MPARCVELREDAAAPTVCEIGSATLGWGPHRFGRSASHHTTDAAIHTVVLAWIVRRASRSTSAPAAATAASSGKKMGKTARTVPADVATPFPPRNPLQTGQMWPTIAAVAPANAPVGPAIAQPSSPAPIPFPASTAITTPPQTRPTTCAVFSPPGLPLPEVRMSSDPRVASRVTSTAVGKVPTT